MRTPSRRTLLLTPLLPLLLAVATCGPDAPTGPSGPSDQALAAMNRGLAQLEMFEYLPASVEFEQAVKAAPQWWEAKVNLAIALMNLQGKEEHARATKLMRSVLEKDPGNPYANFLIGFMSRIDSRAEEAIPYFDRVLESDPGDVGSLFWKGMCLGDLGRHEEANRMFVAALAADPYLTAAYHARHSRLMLLGRPEEAKESRETSDRLRAPRGKAFPIHGSLITAMAYHEIGRYAMAVRDYEVREPVGLEPAFTVAGVEVPLPGSCRYGGRPGPELVPMENDSATSAEDAVLEAVGRIGPGVAVGDIDGDGDADLFLPQWDGPGCLLINDGKGGFSPREGGAGIRTVCRGISAVFFDADGDGDQDLYLACAGPNLYYQNEGDGTFSDRTAQSGLGGPEDAVSVSATPGDFDHEGDLDLFVANYCRLSDRDLAGAPDCLFQNNRDGTFKEIAAEYGIDGGDARSLGALAIDLEKDQDTDLLVIRDRGPAALWLNERIWNFRKGELPPELSGTDPAWGAAAGDLDRDGFEEVLVLRGPGVDPTLFTTDRSGALTAVPGAFSGVRWRTGVFLDIDLDGRLDLVGDGVVRLGEDGRPAATEENGHAPEGSRGMGFADFDGDGDLDRIAVRNDGAMMLVSGTGSNHWLALALEGREALQPAAWSARAGPDQELELRAGRLWQPLRTRATTGFLSTIEGVARFGLGEHTMADLVRIVWPDRVLQVEAEIPADQVKRVVELNRKPASCPMLFAFDGKRFRFVSDFLGVGGLGFFLGPGLYGESDPDEFVRIGKWVRPIDGEIVLQVMEPLEEISYVDEATLLVVDHPAGMDVYPNERYVGEKALFPEARIYGVAEQVFPAAAADVNGRDVLSTLLEVDRIYAPLVPDLRFPGVAREHALTLDFTGRVPETRPGGRDRLVLFLDGWIEYGYSNTFFAAWQAGVECAAPVLEVPDGKGGWTTVLGNMGCPAGLPKGMTVDVTGIVTKESPLLRIRTNLEVYWDRAFLGLDRAEGNVRITRVPLKSAHLHDRGYPREFSPDGRQPLLYDYGIMDPGYTFKYFAGEYTKFGDVTPLLLAADDEYVIMAHGEELTLRYDTGEFPELPEGFARTYILYSAGWCKDMDPYTAFPDTVGPLPFRGMSGYPYGDGETYPGGTAWREKWNTRKVKAR